MKSLMKLQSSGIALAILSLVVTGCGSNAPKLVEVTGKAIHDNEPMIAGSIWFHPDATNKVKGEASSCVLQMDGSFKMRTYPWGDGVPPGKYKVTFSPELAGRVELPDYGDVAKTPLELVVPEAGLKDITVEAK